MKVINKYSVIINSVWAKCYQCMCVNMEWWLWYSSKKWFKIQSSLVSSFGSSVLAEKKNNLPLFHVILRPRSRSRDSGDENEPIQERFFRPHFLQAPGDLTVQEGKLCRMDCKASVTQRAARPRDNRSWLKTHVSFFLKLSCLLAVSAAGSRLIDLTAYE